MGSFFIPMAVMIYVYVRISCVVASRHDKMTEIEVHKVGVPFPRGRVLNDKICCLTNGVGAIKVKSRIVAMRIKWS